MDKHFEDKDALSHVLEKRTEGMLSLSEAHGMEMPGHLAAASDAAREVAMVLLLTWLLLTVFSTPSAALLITLGLGWCVWKIGRSGWLGWARLERLHTVIEQEKYEIEHHRPQEREELIALYRAKGFDGKLLDDVVDVLMADQDRLLKVMLEEEMGLTLEAHEHPLQQSLGSGIGSLSAFLICITIFSLFPAYGMIIASCVLLSASAMISAIYEKNRIIPAVIWNLSIGTLAFGVTYFLSQIIA